MTLRKLMCLCLLGIVLTTDRAEADRVYFSGRAGDGDWNNATNWEKGFIPCIADEAGIKTGMVKITNTVTVGHLKNGINGEGMAETIIDGGTLDAVGTIQYNSASYKARGSITVQNGGSAWFNSRFYVGFEGTTGGSVTIQDGTFTVANAYHHNKDYKGTEPLDTRTTLNPGGLLDVDELFLNAGVMDVAGGTLIVRQNIAPQVNQWIAAGRLIAMGGAAGWKIEASFDTASSCTLIIAVPTDPAKPKPNPLPVPERIPPSSSELIPPPSSELIPPPSSELILPASPKPELPPDLEPFILGRLNPAGFVSVPLAS